MNIDRARARHALDIVEAMKKEPIDKYVSYVKALPATILQNGFGQAMATLLAAAKTRPDDHRRLYDHVEEWLCKENSTSPYHGRKNLMQAITSDNERNYLHAQAEAMAYLQWLKKFAVAYLSTPGSNEHEEKK